jgi:TPR repeat protein
MLIFASVAAVAALSLVLLVNRNAIQESASGLLQSLGVVETVGGVDEAYQAYQNDDGATSLRLARPFAENGDARAQTLLGLIYFHGRGISKDEVEAAKWFRRAADQGDATAQFHLGLMYAKGRGVPQNFAEAAKWVRLAADAGDAEAQFNLGVMYYKGEGVPQSDLNAHLWFNLAAAHFTASERHKRAQATKARDDVEARMTPEEIRKAQKLAREWKPTTGTETGADS